MQFFADEPKYYVILIFPLIVFIFGNSSITHILALSVFCLLYSAGTYFKNYCNMITMIILLPILICQNMFFMAQILQNLSQQNILSMTKHLLVSYEFWVNFLEAVFTCCLGYFSLRQYWKYRSQFERI